MEDAIRLMTRLRALFRARGVRAQGKRAYPLAGNREEWLAGLAAVTLRHWKEGEPCASAALDERASHGPDRRGGGEYPRRRPGRQRTRAWNRGP